MWQKIEFHFKKLNRKTNLKCPKLLHKKLKLQTYLKGGKNCWTCTQKAR